MNELFPMRSKPLVLAVSVIGIAALVIVVFYLWQAQQAQAQTVMSDDGKAALVLTKNALPSGVSLRDISMIALAPEEYPDAVARQGALYVYRLEPDGTQFSEAVTFSITVSADASGTFPFLTLVSGEEITPVDNLVVTAQADGTFLMTGEVRHFSSISILGGFFALDMQDDLGTHLVGDTFNAPVTIVRRNTFTSPSFPKTGEIVEVVQQLVGNPNIHLGHYITKYPIDPRVISDIPSETIMTGNELSFDGQFTCLKETPRFIDQVRYSVLVSYDYSWFTRYPSTGERSREGKLSAPTLTLRGYAEVECVYPEGEEPPKPDDDTLIIPSGDWTGSPPIIMIDDTDEDDVVPPVVDAPPETVPDPVIDATPDVETDTDADASANTSSVDTSCTEPWIYGYPVTDPSNLPAGCQPTNDTPGWDCYTFEDARCTPSTRCFCLTPPESL